MAGLARINRTPELVPTTLLLDEVLVSGINIRLLLLPNCANYRIGSLTAIEIWPGEGDQELHLDDSIYPLRFPDMQLQISAMWALDDFTLENGATV